MPHSINSNVCEGVAYCAEACPVGCIKPSSIKNINGKSSFYIEHMICIDCGVCLQVCPVKGAVIDEERQDIQQI